MESSHQVTSKNSKGIVDDRMRVSFGHRFFVQDLGDS